MGLETFKEWLRGYKAHYTPIATTTDNGEQSTSRSPAWRLVWATLPGLILAGTFCLVLAVTLTTLSRPLSSSSSACQNPVIRQEWRALTRAERLEFIRAVNALAEVPSRWRENGTVYDDFAVLHGAIGSWGESDPSRSHAAAPSCRTETYDAADEISAPAHRSASFLPWHRYTLILFEDALREHAGFAGHVPYWDWSLDWMDLANSSIWSTDDGFGGDGDARGPVVVGDGRCVVDGPFAHLLPILYNHTFARHCLSRGFHDGATMGRLSGEAYRPEKMGEILREPTYHGFRRQLEIYLHGALHQGVNGDFKAMTAANGQYPWYHPVGPSRSRCGIDPLFYVHHAQLDRTWWRWQQMYPRTRLLEYEGRHMFNSTGNATLNDELLYGSFAASIPVAKVMDTEGGFLCYKY
ncbi:putative domain, di-copper centre [Cordyceps fumosorosea ARSEF 2679]|uniref:Putative domain, di-copper centre n=1 Tax=Cordyceps fumosorosea (strain ARSEF 2679) TaxID=1081104 RepID=A0A168DG81_CORFA|nr:putative domain, di-copper centre [Cordyceps fumosorosea ARSEF 2679]OAA72577.1 putative domain, di-copper centre [Cordyceps fumosorosea ARSEF 2679]